MKTKLIWICFLFPLLSKAAQDTTILQDNAPIYTEPTESSEVLEYLPVGLEARISSYPLEGGWYKIRSRAGVYGWINEKDLSVQQMQPVQKATTGFDGPSPVGDLELSVKKIQPERDRQWFIRAGYGFSFFSPTDLNALLQINELNNGNHFLGEMGYWINRQFALVLRIEMLTKNIVARETSSNVVFNLGLRSYPILAGVDYLMTEFSAFRLSAGAFGGIGMSTSFTSEAPTLNAPNIAAIQSSPWMALGRVNLTRPLGRTFSVFLDAGYRYLNTGKLSTRSTASVNGGEYVFAKNGVYRAREINLSGPFISFGLGFHF